MLNSFRNFADSFTAKILLVLLIVTFAAWGIEGMVRNPSNRLTIATVGQEKIGSDEFLRNLNRTAENMKRMMGEQFSPEMLKDPAFASGVLQQLVNNKLLKQESESLGLHPSDKDVVRRIRSNPNFLDDKGNFDKTLFEAMLKRSNIPESKYVDMLRQDIASDLLIDTLSVKSPVPDVATLTLFKSREETRTVTLYNVKSSLITNVPSPDEAQIKAYYDSHSLEFTAPEYRNVSFITLSKADLPKDLRVPEDEILAAYKQRQDEFKKPELRTVEQLLYASKDGAQKAKEMLDAGKSFDQVAKATNVLNKDSLLLGKVERKNMFEGAADAVFSLEKGKTTDLIQSPFGWHIFRVLAIDAPATSTLEEMRPVLVKELEQQVADKTLGDIANKFQDALAGGNSLAEAAAEHHLKVQTVGPFDSKGFTPENIAAKDLPALDKFIEVSFKPDEKSESSMTLSKGGVFYLVHVDKITPSRLRSLDEVKGAVVTLWQKQERDKQLGILAKEISTAFVKAPERSGIIAKYKLQPLKKITVKRNMRASDDISLPAELVSDVFAHKPQEGTGAHLGKNGDYLLAVVDAIIPAPEPESDAKYVASFKAIRNSLQKNQKNEILQQYAQYLSQKYVVNVDESALEAVLK